MSIQPSPGADQSSAPADDPFARTGRERASLVDRNYFRVRETRLNRWKRRLLWLGLLMPLVPLGAAFAWPRGDRIYSRGQVASVHAAWNDRCEACHEPFRPVNDNTWLAKWTGAPHTGRERNERCEHCHAAPVHRVSEKESSVVNCGGCHCDHQGAGASLTRLADADCTSCHRDLPAHRNPSASPDPRGAFAARITDFARDHPEFARLDASRPELQFQPKARALKFSHALHLMPGMDVTGQSKRPPMTYGHLPEAERQRYWSADPNGKGKPDTSPDLKALVQLDCAACHQLDGRESVRTDSTLAGSVPRSAIDPARASGQYMLPVVFETHCKACHPLNDFDPNPANRKLEAPHRVQPAEFRPYLEGLFTRQALEKRRSLKDIPFKPFDRLNAHDQGEARSVADEVKKLVESAERDLFLGGRSCGKCHEYVDGRYEKGVRPMTTPAVWFEHARFNHASHHAVDCRQCHAGAYAAPPGAGAVAGGKLVEQEPLLIDGIAGCRSCHAPASTVDGAPRGGVRSGCTDCHRYHNGDHPLQGIGARSRDPVPTLSLEQLLRGEPPAGAKR